MEPKMAEVENNKWVSHACSIMWSKLRTDIVGRNVMMLNHHH